MVTDDDDIIVTMAGIGGSDYAVRKQMESLVFADHLIEKPYLDFGNLDAHPGIDGLLGADILVQERFIIDLEKFLVHRA